jgi:shikimate dehydrogenase
MTTLEVRFFRILVSIFILAFAVRLYLDRYDLVYTERVTPFLAAARRARRRGVNGLGMLLHQGAVAFEQWTGVAAPVEVMRRALRSAVASGKASRPAPRTASAPRKPALRR